MKDLQRKMVGHGILQIACTLLFGVGYWIKLVGGFEVVPGKTVKFDLPGTDEGWRKAHSGPALNGMMVIATAAVLPLVDLPEQEKKRLAWIVLLDGWANVGFYFFGNFAPSRGLSFKANRHGKSNIFGVIALGPAYLFGVLGLYALGKLGWAALRKPAPAEESESVALEPEAPKASNGAATPRPAKAGAARTK